MQISELHLQKARSAPPLSWMDGSVEMQISPQVSPRAQLQMTPSALGVTLTLSAAPAPSAPSPGGVRSHSDNRTGSPLSATGSPLWGGATSGGVAIYAYIYIYSQGPP